LKEYIKKHLINSRGKSITKKFLVIESDDWGSIRIPNKDVRKYLANEKLIQLTDPFSSFDCIESAEDYQALFQTLSKYKDSFGNHPVITANMVMANPDFQKIKTNKFESFYWESFKETYKNYYSSQQTYASLTCGIEQKYIYPQFHAREHLNVTQWLDRLKSRDQRFLKAFDVNCFAIDDKAQGNKRSNLMASYDYQNIEELNFIEKSIKEGLHMFEQTFGFSSKTSIAPCYVWNNEIENIYYLSGVKGIQSSYIQNKNSNGKHLRVWQKTGDSNQFNQKYFVRNVIFEPALSRQINWVDKAIESIAIAFFWGKPAVISSHRINYVGGLSEDNRNNTLEQLDQLLKRIIKKWPDVQFINSEQLLEAYS
jgi:hypothetical protein